MKLTNRENLPEPLVRAIQNDPYSKGDADFTVTELLQPPRARALIKQHRDEIVEDASDRIWALMGQIGHLILERQGDPDFTERRFFAHFGEHKYKVSGRCDLLKSVLVDYKFCSVWTTKEGVKPEWTQQVNMLVCLANRWDVEIKSAQIVAIFRDWSKPKAAREKNYPQSQVKVLPVELWPLEKTEQFIKERIAAHVAAETELPLCTDEERWKSHDQWALMRKGRKTATKLYNTREDAEHVALNLNNNFPKNQYLVKHRPSEAKRCLWYCAARDYCSQFQEGANLVA